MKRTYFKTAIGLTLVFLPVAVSAQELGNITKLISALGQIVTSLLPILVTIALLVFFWGLIKYISAANSPEEKAQGVSIMVGGVIALFVMVSVWGIVQFIGRALNINQGESVDVPSVPQSGSPRSNFQNAFGGTSNSQQIQTP